MAKKKKNAGRGSIRKLKKQLRAAGHSSSVRKQARARRLVAAGNPAKLTMRKVGAQGTGWMRARRVKIVKRRGHPAQVLIERPRKRARK